MIVSHEAFENLNEGDSFEMTSIKNSQTISLTCAGHMKYPYKYISFNSISSDMYADILFDNQRMMIMRADDEAVSFLEKYTDINYKTNAMFTVKEDASEEEIDSLLKKLRENGFVQSMDNILERSKGVISEYIKAYMLLPIFLVVAALLAYLSITIVNVFKRQREFSVSYLCGASKGSIFRTVLGSCIVTSVVPSVLSILYIIYAPEIQLRMGKNIEDISFIHVIPEQIWIVAAFFVLTVIVSFAAVLISMGRKSPLEYLRGLE